MSNHINMLQNVLTTKLMGTLMGPVRQSQMFDERTFTHFDVFDWQVANGSQLEHPMPFGMFAEIAPENMSVSRLRIMCAPGYFANAPVFNEVCSRQQGISEYICSATVCHKVVAIDAAIETGSTIWSSSIEPIDEVHGMRTTIKNPVLSEQASSQWNEQLNQFLNTTEKLSATFASPELLVAGDVATYTYYISVKCGWWLKRVETFSVSVCTRNFYTTDNYYWPAILREVEFMDWQRRATADQENAGLAGGVDIFPRLYFNPEAYSGPTKTYIEITWSATAPTITDIEPMQPQRIYYGAPFFNLNVPECLHPLWVVQCDIGTSDPQYEENYGSGRTFPPTNFVEWPEGIVGNDDVIPFKGGFLRTKKTFYPPAHNTDNTPEWLGGVDPETPTVTLTDPAEDITDTSFTVRATSDADTSMTMVFRVSTTSNYSNGVNYFTGTLDGLDWIASIMPLLPETTYYVSVQCGYLADRLDGLGNVVGQIYRWTAFTMPIEVETLAP